MNEEAIELVRDYKRKYLFPPQANWPDDEFRRRSYSRWAANEIIHRLVTYPNEDPVHILEEFIQIMDRYSEIDGIGNPDAIFLTAKETAEELLFLLSYKNPNALKGVESNEHSTYSTIRQKCRRNGGETKS